MNYIINIPKHPIFRKEIQIEHIGSKVYLYNDNICVKDWIGNIVNIIEKYVSIKFNHNPNMSWLLNDEFNLSKELCVCKVQEQIIVIPKYLTKGE